MTHWIQDYIDLVRSGEYPVCEEQHMLIDLVEKNLGREGFMSMRNSLRST